MSLEEGVFVPLKCKSAAVVVVVVVVVVPFQGHTLRCHLRQCIFLQSKSRAKTLGPGETMISILTNQRFILVDLPMFGELSSRLILLILDESSKG